MEKIKERLSGVFAPLITPFQDDKILFNALSENVEQINESGLKGYFVLGTNGEYKSLSIKERILVLKTVKKYSSSDKVIMAGTGMESTKETIDVTLRAADAGAEMISLLMPHFFAKRIDDEVLISYILDIADISPLPVLLYNNPSVAAGVTVTLEVIEKVSGHPNIVGIKESSTGNYKSYMKIVKQNFYVLAGSANLFLDILMAGGVGGVLSLANVIPEKCVRLYRAFMNRQLTEVKNVNEALIYLNKKVSGKYGVAGVKAAMDIIGYVGGEPRKPIKGLTELQREELKKEISYFLNQLKSRS